MLHVAAYIEAAAGSGQDRILWLEGDDLIGVALADGMGGMGGGTLAAESAVQYALEAMNEAPGLIVASQWPELFWRLDRRVNTTREAGETTLVALETDGRLVCGASCGDSGAWLVAGDRVVNLTEHQMRKPLVGSGQADPVSFTAELGDGLLLVASDGLFRYTGARNICETVRRVPLPDLPRALVDLVRLKSGRLQDDVAVFVAGRPPQ
ncbi:MAG: SpoIIE family protein phosphatase [Planctomycetes bacterium]|jgi:serine/threonine protein phosphatase PrpC|nr:SpoIIE family protein phosphatase [Planctomycetota bacterium]MCL4731681.1 SpoIIE family protein phosphatase [Planctomycetota bacterium]